MEKKFETMRQFVHKFRELEPIVEDMENTIAMAERSSRIPELEQELLIKTNTQHAMYDGIKMVYDRENPFPLILPMEVKANAWYTTPEGLGACFMSGVATEENWHDFIEIFDEL